MNNLGITIAGTVLVVAILALPLQAEEVNEIDLVKMHAPILTFHPSEGNQCCYPSDAEEAYLRLHPDGSLDELREPKTFIPNTPCYFQICLYDCNLGDVTRIKYWFWYNFNDFPECPDIGGSHPGDWESVEVDLVNGQVYCYQLSNHEGWITFWPDDPEVILENGHIKVWAGNGSHANYPSPSPDYVYCYEYLCCDQIADSTSVWHTMDNLKAIVDTNFADYTGHWGDPVSPVGRQLEWTLYGENYKQYYRFKYDVNKCDTTCDTWSWGPSCDMRFDAGLKISATCPDGGCIRFIGEPFNCTDLWSYKLTESETLFALIRIYNGEIRLFNNGSIRFLEP